MTEPSATVPSPPDPDNRVVRRALVAGAIAWGSATAVLLVAGARVPTGRAAGIAALLGLVFGSLMTSGWLVLAAILDLVAGASLGRRRIVWTVVAFTFAFLAPTLVLGAIAG